MKKLYRKGTVHPSPPIVTSCHLSVLPAALITLAAALSPEDREVLAYLISFSNSNSSLRSVSSSQKKNKKPISTYSNSSNSTTDHAPAFHCDCFRCYTSFWARWDSSPNRELIHEIIDAYEDGLEKNRKMKKKDRRKRGGKGADGEGADFGGVGVDSDRLTRNESSAGRNESRAESALADELRGGDEAEEEAGAEKGSVRRFVSFIGERLLGVWG